MEGYLDSKMVNTPTWYPGPGKFGPRETACLWKNLCAILADDDLYVGLVVKIGPDMQMRNGSLWVRLWKTLERLTTAER